jgi:predicted amidohydrolase YtcJ
MTADTILHNARIITNTPRSTAQAIAIANGKIVAVGSDDELLSMQSAATRLIDCNNRTLVPGFIDSHIHAIRGGLNFNMELRWEGVPSLVIALRMLKRQAERTPPPQWVRVIGGWSEFQFAERRMPTLEEINAVSPETPVIVSHLYDRVFVNAAGLRVLGYTKDTPEPPNGEIQRDGAGRPTGLLIAKPNAWILYSTIFNAPKLNRDDQVISTRQYMRELNRFGITSVNDAGGGFFNYPDDYGVIEELHGRGELTLRFAYNLFATKPKQELQQYAEWMQRTRPGSGDDFYRMNGAGEMLVFSAADFEDFLEPRPDMAPIMEAELKAVVRHLAANRWPFRLHATYEETIERALNVYEEVNRETPFEGLHWIFDHCETISDRSIERIAKLGGGIAVQSRMAFQGEYFLDRYGSTQTARTPPIRRMLELGAPVGMGTDATRITSYNPFITLYWLVTGKTVGGRTIYPSANRMSREEALRLYTVGSSWFSSEEGKKGALVPGQFADLAVLSGDYFAVSDEQIKDLESVLTMVDGRVVYAAAEFGPLGPPPPPVSPDWSPIGSFGGGYMSHAEHARADARGERRSNVVVGGKGRWSLGCRCAF